MTIGFKFFQISKHSMSGNPIFSFTFIVQTLAIRKLQIKVLLKIVIQKINEFNHIGLENILLSLAERAEFRRANKYDLAHVSRGSLQNLS